ncbi:MHYT domain-containing protein, partial [Brevundimonas sp.]|uniref:MHYT domain-containing protein n=1 Tax=Brevundimonas sp. TaxID=1871086 RepID=UPI002FCC132A
MGHSHDIVFVALSFGVAILASWTALGLLGRVRANLELQRALWLVATATAMGGGIWSMHFIGMLAMKMSMPISYHLPLTAFSFVIALVSATLAITIAISGKTLSTKRLAVATSVLSSGVVTMHYVGMAAIIEHAAIAWNSALILLSVVIAVVASGAGLWLAFHLRQNTRRALVHRLIAALVMALAIASMHYTGMGAATFTHAGHALHSGITSLE